jgi:hypothetical protein
MSIVGIIPQDELSLKSTFKLKKLIKYMLHEVDKHNLVLTI